MTAGDRLPSYPRSGEEQFVSALDLMGIDTTILSTFPDDPRDVTRWCKFPLNFETNLIYNINIFLH